MKKLAFIPQLDSFRFLAVGLVIISHWVPNNVVNTLPNGFLGVTFFFVLSGYLISTNLIYLKRSITDREITTGHALKLFYIKRSLRIFPLYFLVLLLVYVIDRSIFLGHVAWYFTYTPNFLIYKEKSWQGMLSHFWSLAVEEQFYLIWPMLIFLVRPRWLKYLFPGIIVASILYKCIVYRHEPMYIPFAYILPFSCFDAFGIGALLAYYSLAYPEKVNRICSYGSIVFFSVIGAVLYFTNTLAFLFSAVVSCGSACIIGKSAKGFKGIAGAFLQNTFIRYLGKISYGLYVYHNFMPWLWRCFTGQESRYPLPVLNIFHGSWAKRPSVALGMEFLLLVGIASVSWFVVEKPMNDLKNRLS